MNLLFKFTLSNSIEGSLEIKEPDGWDDGVLKLERNKDYHSIVEYYSQPLVFDDAQSDGLPGGLTWIKNIEATQGPDAIITITIELSEDEGDSYETCFIGILDIDTFKEIDFYKLECGVKRDDFWSKFINRKSIPVDLQSVVDLDGNARTLVDGFTLPLPTQRIISNYYSEESDGEYLPSPDIDDPSKFMQFFPNNILLDEIKDNFNLLSAAGNSDIPVWFLSALYDGIYEFDIRIEISATPNDIDESGIGPGPLQDSGNDLDGYYIKVNNDDPIAFTEEGAFDGHTYDGTTTYGCWANYPFSAPWTGETEITSRVYILTQTFNFKKGDIVRIYGVELGEAPNYFYVWGRNGVPCTNDPELDTQTGIPPGMDDNPTYFRITADTTYNDTETDAYLLKDAGESILSKLVGADNVLQSDYLDGGCGDKYAIMKGLHVRGYSFADKPFALSFDKWWDGANPILNLGLGYETGNKIRIEQKGFFYDKTSTSVDLDFVNNIERSYAQEYIIKSIEMGYQKWSAESASGVDDPQSKRTWRTRFATIGKDEKLLSEFIAASLAIEQTRRNRVEQGKDWRLDDDILIIAVDPDLSPLQPEFDENFDAITGLLNSDARYNIRLSVARNFERWIEYFNGCLQWYEATGEQFTFASGEGNYDMTSQISSTDCESVDASPEPVINEKGNFDVTDLFYFMPIQYDFEHPLTYTQYKAIRDNPTKAIGVSRSDTGHVKCFIWNLDYKPTHGIGTFTVMLAENDPL